MSSRAWTEVAIGAEARSFPRWVWRVAMGVAVRKLMLLVGMIGAILAFGSIYWTASELPYDWECWDQCNSLPPKDLLDLLL